MQQMVRSGIRNLMQTVMIGRISDPDEAEGMAKFFRTVYESLTRSDPASQSRIPVDAANIAALPEYNLLVRAITASRDSPGTEAQPVFLTRTLAMPEVQNCDKRFASGTWHGWRACLRTERASAAAVRWPSACRPDGRRWRGAVCGPRR